MNFDLKRAEIYNNLICFYKEINIFEEVIYLIQHLNDYLVLHRLEESLTKKNTNQYKNFIEFRMSCLNYLDKQSNLIGNYNVSEKKFNELENNRFGNKLYYKKTDNLKDELPKKNFKTYSADLNQNELVKYNLLPKRMMKKKFYAFQKKPIDKKIEERKNDNHVNLMKKEYSDKQELFAQRGYLNQSISDHEEELTARERPKLMIDEEYLNKFCKSIVKKEFEHDINVYGEYAFLNKCRTNKELITTRPATKQMNPSLMGSVANSTSQLNPLNQGIAQSSKTLDNFYVNGGDNSVDKMSLKQIFNNFEQIDKRTKEKFYNTFYKYNKSITMAKHPLKEINVYEEKVL